MKFTILGSAAAECMPGLFCECDFCNKIRAGGDPRDRRRRTSYLIDEDTLVDLGPDFYNQVVDFHLDERKIRNVIFTHRHEDHLNPMELFWRHRGYSVVPEDKWIDLFWSAGAQRRADAMLAAIHGPQEGRNEFERMEKWGDELYFRPHLVAHGTCVENGDLTIRSGRADHDRPEGEALLHAISRGGKTVLILNDTGTIPEETVEMFRGLQADLAVIDTTMTFRVPDNPHGHLGVNSMLAQIPRLKAAGALREGATVVANHFTHNGHATHAELEAYFKPHGVLVGYDGLVLDI